MSKIELTEAQARQLVKAAFGTFGLNGGSEVGSYGAMLDKAIELGLVRPASDDLAQRADEAVWDAIEDRLKAHDDLAARVAAVEAYINGDEPGVPPNVRTPDPHAAAKERAKLWGARLLKGFGGEYFFLADTHYCHSEKNGWEPRTNSLGKSDEQAVSDFSGKWRDESSAWSNFPTEPPPGWEAPKPRTDADSLGEVAYNVLTEGTYAGEGPPAWINLLDRQKEHYRKAAHAVRKAVLAAQLEPSVDEITNAWAAMGKYAPSGDVTAALIAAARVRLEKAEGEVP